MLKGDVGRLKSGGRTLRKESAFGIQEKKMFQEENENNIWLHGENKTQEQDSEITQCKYEPLCQALDGKE